MKKLLKPFIFILFAALIAFPSHAQRWKLLRYEAALGIGTCNIFGDIGGSATQNNLFGLKDIKFTTTRPSIIFGARYKWMENQAFKLNLDFCMGGGSDAGSKHGLVDHRDLSFSTILFEHSLQYEYYFIPEDISRRSSAAFSRSGMMNNFSHISAYGFAGLGGLFYMPTVTGTSPTAQIETKLGNGYTLAVPAGVGAKLVYNNHWAFNAELGYRFTLSDGLDGFTTKYSKANDIYWILNFTACYRIRTSRNGFPEFMARWFPNARTDR